MTKVQVGYISRTKVFELYHMNSATWPHTIPRLGTQTWKGLVTAYNSINVYVKADGNLFPLKKLVGIDYINNL